jgi:phosphoribosylanthranilate isomerase
MTRVRIKICGITSVDDAILAGEAGADAIGLNLYRGSPRRVTMPLARLIARHTPAFVDAAVLFVNEPLTKVLATMEKLVGLRTIQWHGDDPEMPPRGPWRYVPAFPVRDTQSLEQVRGYLRRCGRFGHWPAAVLLDGHVAGHYGGTGTPAPWQLLAEFRTNVPIILAGGLTPDNVSEAIRLVRPYAVDVASGVESSPGRKDPGKLRRFIDAVRETASG